jgi:hypothetical protein
MKSATSAVVGSLCCALACLSLTACGGGRFSKEIGSLLTEEITGRNLPVTITGQRVTCVSRDLHGTLIDFEATLRLAEPLYKPTELEVKDAEEPLARSKNFMTKMEPVLTDHERQSLPPLPDPPTVYEVETPKGKTINVFGTVLILDGGPTSEYAVKLLNFKGDFAVLAGQRLQEGWVLKEDSDKALRAYRKELDQYVKAVRELWDIKAKPAVEMLKKHPALDGYATSYLVTTPEGPEKWNVSAEFLLDDASQEISGWLTWRNPNDRQSWNGEITFSAETKQPQILMSEGSLRDEIRKQNPTYNQGSQHLLNITATGWSGEWRNPPLGGDIVLSARTQSQTPTPIPTPTTTPIPIPVITPTPTAEVAPTATPTPTPDASPVAATALTRAVSDVPPEPGTPRFVAVKVSEDGPAANVRLYDTKKNEWLDESTFRLDSEPALGKVLELDGVKAVYVGRQDFGSSPSASPTPGVVSEASSPYPVSGAVVRIENVRLDDGILGGAPTKDLRFQIVAAGASLPDGEGVRANVVFYDTADAVVMPTLKPVSSVWVNPPVDWTDNGLEELIITCVQAPSGTGSPSIPAYHGYAIMVYYRGILQDAKAAPADLLQAFPPPKTYQEEAQAPPSSPAPAIASVSPGSKKSPPAAAAVSQPIGQQTVQEGLEKNIQAVMSPPQLQEARKQGTRYVAVDAGPGTSGTKPVMIFDVETGQLVGNTVYNIKATPTPTPKPKSKPAVTTRYIARVVPPTAKSPRGTFQLRIFDRDTGRPATKLVYNVKRIPENGAELTFDNNIIATFVNP